MTGILPALITPLDGEGKLAESALERLCGELFVAGVHGLYCTGNTGEGPRMSLPLRKQLLERARQYSPAGKLVVAHVGAGSTEDAIDLARHAERAGADAISSLPPVGDFARAREHYRRLAEATGLPLYVYFFPDVAPSISKFEEIEQLLTIPGIAGLKFTDFNFYVMSRISLSGKTVFNGRDECLAAGMLMGAHGGIGSFYNVVPRLVLDIYERCRANDWEAARRQQDRLNELITITLRYPFVPALKTMLAWSGMECGISLGPVARLSVQQETELRAELDQATFSFGSSLAMVR